MSSRTKFPIEDLEAIEDAYESVVNVDDFNPMLIALQKKIGVDVQRKARTPKKRVKRVSKNKKYTNVRIPKNKELQAVSLLKQGYSVREIERKVGIADETVRKVRINNHLSLIPMFKFKIDDVYLTSLSCLSHWGIKADCSNRAKRLTRDMQLSFSIIKLHWGELPINAKYMLVDDDTIYTKDTKDFIG